MRKFSKKTSVLGVVVALVATAAAIAYWSTTGSGTGSAGVAADNGTLSLSATVPSGIAPGTSKSVSFKASNPSSTDLRVASVSLSSVTVDAAHADCDVDDFSMDSVTQNQTIAAGASNVALANSGLLEFANSAVSQDDCKGATLTLNLTSN